MLVLSRTSTIGQLQHTIDQRLTKKFHFYISFMNWEKRKDMSRLTFKN